MKKYILLYLLSIAFLNYNSVFGMIGLADETYITPYGNEIDNWTGNTLRTGKKEQITGLDKWYFYKGFIIGKCRCSPSSKNRNKANRELGNYFVFNEKNNQSYFFETELEWNAFLKQNYLELILWTRWHDGGDAGNIILIIAFLLIFYFFISIPLLIWFFVSFYKSLKKEVFKFSNPHFIIIIGIMCLFFLMWILEKFPSSI